MRIQLFYAFAATFIINTNSYCMEPEKPGSFSADFQKDMQKMRQDFGSLVGPFAPRFSEWLKGEIPEAITKNPYKDVDAFVRQGTDFSEGEKEFLKKRLPIVKASLEKLLNRPLSEKQTPKIAMIFSGGGCRATNYTVGTLQATEEMGLLDGISYVVGLSGSTWAIAPWISTEKPLKSFRRYIVKRTTKPFTEPTADEELLICDAATIKSLYGQTKTPVDLYGDLLGNRLLKKFGNKRQEIYLSQQARIIENGTYPYPIYTTILADEQTNDLDQIWYEFTPHERGSRTRGIFIPTWAHGREFENGKSVKGSYADYPPEKNLSYDMGTWGSAYGANMAKIKRELAQAVGHKEFIESLLPSLDSVRPLDFYAEVPNCTYKLNPANPGPKNTCFIDAGTAFNIPTPALRDRDIGIIFIVDVSAGKIGYELKEACQYMKKHNLPFPDINCENIDKKTASIFKDENNPKVPVVIYLPRISDKELWEAHKSNPEFAGYQLDGFDLDYETNNGFARTQEFEYTPENSEKVMWQAQFNLLVNRAKIIEAIKWKADQMSLEKA